MEKISVIVPVFNVEKYLEKCLNSIIEQTYKNVEIILVNDGSTDNSEKICKKYLEIDNRIKLVTQKNEGLSSARNTGIKNSNSDYILFIDSDDYIEKNMIEILYENIKKDDFDVSVCGIFNVYKTKKSPQYEKDITFSVNKKEFLKEYLIGAKIPGSICNKLIKSSIAKNLTFPVGKIYEDAFYHFDLIKFAKNFIVTTKPLYNYFHRENSNTTKPYSKSNLDIIEAYTKFYNFILENYKDLENEAFFRLSHSYFIVLDKILEKENYKSIEDFKKILKFLKENWLKIVKNKIFRKNRRIATVLLKINVKIYRFLLLKEINKNKKIN